MEVETMLQDNGETTTQPVMKRKSSKQPFIKWKATLLKVGASGLVIISLVVLVSVAIYKLVPHSEKHVTIAQQQGGIREIHLKAIFSTNYVLEKGSKVSNIININNITDQLNIMLNGNLISVIDAFFRNHSVSKGVVCENPLAGYILQLNLMAFYPRKCAYQDDDMCKMQVLEQLKSMFSQITVFPITVLFHGNRFDIISVKICSLAEMTEAEEETGLTAVKIKAKKSVLSYPTPQKMARNIQRAIATPHSAAYRTRCALCINKIRLVKLPGEHGQNIDEEVRTHGIYGDDRYRQDMTATVYEDSVYRLYVQLDCNGGLNGDPFDTPCSRSLSVMVWIDYNNNEVDDRESRLLERAWSSDDTSTGTYNLDLHIPRIDDVNSISGPHRMTITVVPSEDYQRECGQFPYRETREYSVNVIPRLRPIVQTTTIRYNPPACPLSIAKIVLVIMAGEKGTEIRDDRPADVYALGLQNQHHKAVTLFEHTVYLMRIQLDCSTQMRTELTSNGCNLAQDVNIWIDLNDDGNFDSSEVGAPYRWPVTSYMTEGIYDIQIYVPALNNQYIRSGTHKLRITVTPTDHYKQICGPSNYCETREYLVTIIPRMKYSAVDATPRSSLPSDVSCSPDVGKVILVVMAGEHRTQIRDDDSTRSVLSGNTRNYQYTAIVLYEDTVYLLRIQLECTGPDGRVSVQNNCNLPHDVAAWIDLNDDGRFDDSEYAAPYRWPLASYIPQGVYDLQIYVPVIDGRKTKSGPHRMRLDVMLNEEYRAKCKKDYYRETREYNVTIVHKNMKQTVDIGGPYLTLSDDVCSQTNGKIVLVIMAGEQGSHIRDDTPINTVIRENQNQHHMGISVYENTIYRIRIQLDCDQRSSRSSFKLSCNLAQDVNVWIDFNNDGKYDDSESRVPYRWPLRSTMTVGIYDLEIPIPSIDGYSTKSGPHRMRIVVQSSDEYIQKCGRSDYSETREYTVNVMPKSSYVEAERTTSVTYCPAGHVICSEGNSAISLVSVVGEQRTEINDDTRKCNSANNYNDQSDLSVTFYENSAYKIHIDLACVQQSGYTNTFSQDPYSFETNCNDPRYLGVWIDFNDDGSFDERTDRVIPNGWHRDDPRLTQFDLRITIPQVDGQYYVEGQHRMRIALTQDERYLTPCQNTGYGEVRDYTVRIIRRSSY